MSADERLGRIEERLDSLCDVLLDNGQPGALTKHDTRLAALEGWKSYASGALVVIMFMMSAAITIGGVLLARMKP